MLVNAYPSNWGLIIPIFSHADGTETPFFVSIVGTRLRLIDVIGPETRFSLDYGEELIEVILSDDQSEALKVLVRNHSKDKWDPESRTLTIGNGLHLQEPDQGVVTIYSRRRMGDLVSRAKFHQEPSGLGRGHK